MKLFNKGKANITYETKPAVIKDDRVIEKAVTKDLVPNQAAEVSPEVGKKLLRLYPTILIDMDKVTAEDLMVAKTNASAPETESPKAVKKA